MKSILFSTTEFCNWLGVDQERAFWGIVTVAGTLLGCWIIASAIEWGTRNDADVN